MSDCVVLVPMLGRPGSVAPLLESLARSTPDAVALFIVSEADTAVVDATAHVRRLVVPGRDRGDYPAKINAGCRATDEPLILLGASDIRFRAGWLEACLREVENGAQVVGTNDLGNPRTMSGEHSTHTLITREYAALPCLDGSPGPLFEGYWHEYCDDELVATAKRRRVWAHAPDAHVEHLHWTWGKRERDATDRDYLRRFRESGRTYRRRRHLWA